MFFKFYDIIETHPYSYFNYLCLCWMSGIFNDDYVLTEIAKSTNSTSLFFGIIYEA
jgi:hypothetical protein